MKKNSISCVSGAVKAGMALALLPLSIHVQALEYDISDDLKVNLDTTLTYGRQWRVEGRDKNLITYDGKYSDSALLNGQIKQAGYGACVPGQPGTFPGNPCGGQPRSQSDFTNLVLRANSDDGDRNFDKWDVVSSRYAGIADLNVSYKNVGMFLRGQAFYDEVPFEETSYSDKYLEPQLWNGPYGRGTINNYADGEINNRKHFGEDYKEISGADVRFLDAYVYGSFAIGDSTLDLRIGRQVISWGEALMLQGGIGFAQNRIDASAATVPGAELKEIFQPTGAVYGAMNVMEGLTLEAYWQYEFIESTLFPSGSFFNMNDVISSDVLYTFQNSQYANAFGAIPGAYPNGAGYPGYADPDLPLADLSAFGTSFGGVPFGKVAGTNGIMTRTEDVLPEDDKQFGLAMRYLLGEGTEMGVYIVNYHDKLPTLWAGNETGQPGKDGSVNPALAGHFWVNPILDNYTVRYMDDIRLYGLTLNTVIGDVQTGIEYAYRANAPVVPGCTREVIIQGKCKDRSLTDMWEPSNFIDPFAASATAGQFNDHDHDGKYDKQDLFHVPGIAGSGQVAGLPDMLFAWPVRAEVHSLNLGMTYIFEPSPLWDNAILVGELGSWYIAGFDDDQLKQSHLGSFTKTGAGMSAQFMPEYKNVMEGVDLVVPFFVNYGIEGSEAYFNYTEKSLWWSVGVEANYLEHWRLATYYNNFSGPNNLWADRDNVSVNVKYSF